MAAATPQEFFGEVPPNEWVTQLGLRLVQKYGSLKHALEKSERFETFQSRISGWRASQLDDPDNSIEQQGQALFEICREFELLELLRPDAGAYGAPLGRVRGVRGAVRGDTALDVLREVARLMAA